MLRSRKSPARDPTDLQDDSTQEHAPSSLEKGGRMGSDSER